MSAFAGAIDALFADPHLARDAVSRVGGADPGIPVRVILRRPDRVNTFGETRIVAETVLIDVRVSEVATPADGDTFEISAQLFAVQGAPMRDAERLVWMIEARPQ